MRPDGLPDLRTVPALVVALGLAGGIVFADALAHASVAPLPTWPWALAAALGALGALVPEPPRLVSLARLARMAALVAAAVALGGLLAARDAARPPTSVAHLVPLDDARAPDTVLDGTVAARPKTRAGRTRFALATDHAGASAPGVPTIRVAVTGTVEVTLAGPSWEAPVPFSPLRVGDRVRLTGRLDALPVRRNPSDFDYGRWLARQGRVATLRVFEPHAVQVVAPAHPTGFAAATGMARQRIETAIARYIPSADGQALHTALLLGDRSALEPEAEEAFRRTGLTHLLAVSGLHVLLVGMLLYGLLAGVLRRLTPRRVVVDAVRAVVTLGVLVVYAAVTGGSASVVRAVVMAAALIGADLAQRSSSAMNALGLAMLVVLAIRPAQVFEAGFLLSFSAVAGLVLLVPVLRRPIERRPRLRRLAERPGVRGLVTSVLATLAASLATLPVLLAVFGRLPLGGLLLNIPAIPLTSLTFSASLATVAFADVPALAAPLGRSADVLARALLTLTERGDAWLGALAYEGATTGTLWTLVLASLVATFAAWPRRRLRAGALAATLALVCGTVWAGALGRDADPHLDVLFFDVGQGDAALVRLPGGTALLIDTGPSDERGDAATRTILPHLRQMGIDGVDVVVSHPHRDHEGGLPALLRTGRIHTVVHNGDNFASDVHRSVVRLTDSLGVAMHAVRAGDRLALDPNVTLDFLAPADTLAHPAETNDASLVMRLRYGRTTWLFLGDAQLPSEARLVARYGSLLGSSVVKVGHHGSRTSSSPALVAAVATPGCHAVVSVAARNVYRLPNPEVIRRWQSACPNVHETSTSGAVWLRSDGLTVEEVSWRR